MQTNKAQSEAISHKEGPMMVLAGPGSGKTLVITQRTKYLIEKYGVNPSKILVITFTKAAASEMKERFKKIMGEVYAPVYFGTFHSVFFAILRQAYNFNGNNILRESQRIQFLKEIVEKLELEIDDESDFISGITGEISAVKNERIPLEHYYSMNCSEEVFRVIYRKYEEKLRRANLIDFDDMLVFCYELFKERPDILAAWQKRFKYILIDEFQDINQVQYDIVRMLAMPEDNLFIVGDDDQSIYRFRGAKPEIMLNFEKDYKQTKKVLLDINYRSSVAIVDTALRVIKNNRNRFAKSIRTINGNGAEVVYRTFDGQPEENKDIVENILRYTKSGYEFSDIAVLFRTNTQSRLLIEKLMEYNIPFTMRDSIPNIYEHWITGNIISYIRIAMGSKDRKEFLQIINRPKRYVSREYINTTEISLEKLKEVYKDKEWMQERIEKLEYDIKLLGRMDTYSAINYIRKGIGYEEYLAEYADFRKIKVEDLMDVLDEIQESSKNYKTFEDWFAHIEEYTIEIREQEKNKQMDANSVSLSTMHSSKGLEYKLVFIIDANEGITPHKKAVVDADLEEERRMFYVAMTRAKEQLFIYSLKERFNKKLEISRFVGESLVDSDELKEGALVFHKVYKEGIVEIADDRKMTVYFKRPDKHLVLDKDFCISNRLLTIERPAGS
ncbi:ATP-dependent helicase [Anaerobium acetethylicum]|uniref:DNA 3'-5' helicase n=1 Tax=Anaerobium acetethylicum TaxID=1619234 RepID=A0A1D3TS72_9FIRM|nr:ATP-dependent helicase [Anaerobium acetethylicum]SCP96620.1 DNA helicase-2 / ATP-dependent DNA helicase PcrA [Anaerobium acetethylicum]